MPHIRCPVCALRLDRASAMELDCCPRCIVNGRRVRLEAELGPLFESARAPARPARIPEAAVTNAMKTARGRRGPRSARRPPPGTTADRGPTAGNRADRSVGSLPGGE
jgi:Zn-finger nucleic acid-binding protein